MTSMNVSLTSRMTFIGNTFCFSGASGGPNQADCTVIADAILYDSQNTGALFNATAAGVRSLLVSPRAIGTYF